MPQMSTAKAGTTTMTLPAECAHLQLEPGAHYIIHVGPLMQCIVRTLDVEQLECIMRCAYETVFADVAPQQFALRVKYLGDCRVSVLGTPVQYQSDAQLFVKQQPQQPRQITAFFVSKPTRHTATTGK